MYNNAELEIVRFAAEDVLATSTTVEESSSSSVPESSTGPINLPNDDF